MNAYWELFRLLTLGALFATSNGGVSCRTNTLNYNFRRTPRVKSLRRKFFRSNPNRFLDLRGGANDDNDPPSSELEDSAHEGWNGEYMGMGIQAALWADLGCLLGQYGQPEAAVNALAYALHIAPATGWPLRPRLLSALGMTMREAGRLEESVPVLKLAAQSNPTDPNIWWNLGTALYQTDQETAQDAYMRACHVAPSNWEGVAPVLNNLATMLLDQMKDSDNPPATVNSAANNDPAALNRTRLLDTAAEALRESLRREPDAACTLANLANALWSKIFTTGSGGGGFEAAALIASLEQGQVPVTKPSAEQMERLSEVAQVLKHALEVVPRDWLHTDQLWVKLCIALLVKGDFVNATRQLIAAMRSEGAGGYPPEWWCTIFHYLSICVQHDQGHEGSIRDALLLAVKVCPVLPETQAEIGKCMLRCGMVDDSLKHLEKALKLAEARDSARHTTWPGRAPVLHAIGLAHSVNSDVEKAIKSFRLALEVAPAVVHTRFLLARALAENGDEKEALEHLETAAKQGLWVTDRLLSGPAFHDLRSHPRFKAVRAQMKQNEKKGGGGGGASK